MNGSLEVFLPWFTSASPNDIQLHVLLTPADPSTCLAALAHGVCERERGTGREREEEREREDIGGERERERGREKG